MSTKRAYTSPARAAAAEATRARIADAAVEQFLARPYDEVTLRELAAAAGVALQTVVNHFATKEGVLSAAGERFRGQVEELRGQAPVGDIPAAIDVLMDDYERTGDASLRLLAVEERVPVAHELLQEGREVHRTWVARTFPAALAGLRGDERARRLAALCTVTDAMTWRILRRDHGLSREQTAATLRELVRGLHPDPQEDHS